MRPKGQAAEAIIEAAMKEMSRIPTLGEKGMEMAKKHLDQARCCTLKDVEDTIIRLDRTLGKDDPTKAERTRAVQDIILLKTWSVSARFLLRQGGPFTESHPIVDILAGVVERIKDMNK